jgi:hypothetical protein
MMMSVIMSSSNVSRRGQPPAKQPSRSRMPRDALRLESSVQIKSEAADSRYFLKHSASGLSDMRARESVFWLRMTASA